MTGGEYRDAMGEAYEQLGLSNLEGCFVALMLESVTPIALGEAADDLHVSKASLSRLANAMLERGDLKREGDHSSRRHLYSMVDDANINALRGARLAARAIADASSARAADPTQTVFEAIQKLSYTAAIYGQAAMALDRVLAPKEKLQSEDLERHHREGGDTTKPGE